MSGRNVDSPSEFAESMCWDQGIANTIIQLGDIQGRRELSRKINPKKIMKDVSKYHEFLFMDEGILARLLPGFGKGELLRVAEELDDLGTNPIFVFKVVSRQLLTENLQCRNATVLPYKEECQEVHDIKGEHANAGRSSDMIVAMTEQMDDSEDEEEQLVWFCKNPLCTKTFLRAKDYLKHRDNPEDLCVAQAEEKLSSNDQIIDMYISRNGISQRYKGKTFAETRSMIFHSELLPTIDPFFIIYAHKEDLEAGHALPKSRHRKAFSTKQIVFLEKAFKAGIGKQKHRRKTPAQVEKEMQEADFEVDEWLTEIQISKFFTRLKAKQTSADPTEEPSAEKMDEVSAIAQAKHVRDFMDRLEAGMDSNEDHTERDDNDGVHPIFVENLHLSLCDLAKMTRTSQTMDDSALHQYKKKELAEALESLGLKVDRKKSKVDLCKQIVKYVQENCDCLMYLDDGLY